MSITIGEASTSRSGLAFLEETTTWGAFEGGSLQKLRRISDSLTQANQEIENAELSDDRMTADGQLSGVNIGGGLSTYMIQSAAYRPLYGMLSFNALSTAIAVSATDISFAASDQSMNSAGGFGGTLPVAGQWIYVSGPSNAGNRGLKRVVSATSSKVIFEGSAIVDESAGATIKVRGQFVRGPGIVPRPITIEKILPRSGGLAYLRYLGMLPQSGAINAATGSAITCNFEFVGKSMTTGTSSIGSGYLAAPTAPMHGPVHGVYGQIYGGSVITPGSDDSYRVQSFAASINNNLQPFQELGVLGPADLIEGDGVLTGTSTILFRDLAKYDAVRNYGVTTIGLAAITSGVGMTVTTIPRARLTGGDPQTSSKNTPITMPIGFRAERDDTYGCRWQFDFIDLSGL